VQSAVASTVRPAAALLVGVAVTLSAIAVLLLGVSGGIAAKLGWSLWIAQLTTAGAFLLISGVIIFAAVRRLTKSSDPIVRSLRELSENLASLKQAVTNSDTTTRP
jgi:hypothetical protein